MQISPVAVEFNLHNKHEHKEYSLVDVNGILHFYLNIRHVKSYINNLTNLIKYACIV